MAQHQAEIQLVVSPNPRRLLEHAADGFLTPRPATAAEPFPSPPYLLALRQGGLRDDLIDLAAGRGIPGWFDPPLCTFHELPDRFGTTELEPCDDYDRLLILGGALRRLGGEIFGRLRRAEDFLAALDRLFGELAPEGVSAAAFRATLERRTGRDRFERERDTELALIYEAYLDALAGAHRRDGRDVWLDCARAASADPDGLAERLGGRREIRLVGLNDLRRGWRPLLRALRASPALDRIIIYAAAPLELGEGLTPTIIQLDGTAVPPGAAVIAAPDADREVNEVARRVRALCDSGVPPHRIAVVARQARPHLALALAALDRFGVPATARRRHALREIPVVRALRALLAAAADGWSRHALAELAEQPYFASELDAGVINRIGFRYPVAGLDGWRAALEDFAQTVGAGAAVRAEQAAAAFDRFAGRARVLDEPRPLREWLDWLGQFLTDDPWEMQQRMHDLPDSGGQLRFNIIRRDLAGWRGVASVADRWRSALDHWGGGDDRLDALRFQEQLDDLLDGDVALWTPVHRGVQVLEGLAAAYRSFDHVFLVGLEAGRFPVSAPTSPLLEESERRALAELGLPFESREVWDGRERELFDVLVAGAGESLTISYARLDPSGRDTLPSMLIEALGGVTALSGAGEDEEMPARPVLTPGMRLYSAPATPAGAERIARIELDRATGRLSPYNGLIESADLRAWLASEFGDGRVWTPTELEAYAKCPWAYFSGRLLSVARLEDPDDGMAHTVRGTILHDALHRFYDGAQARTGGPVFLMDADLEWAQPLLEESLDAALADAAQSHWLGHPALAGARRAELSRMLRRFLEAEAKEHEDMYRTGKRNAPAMVRTGVTRHELRLDHVLLERNGVRFQFRGSVDRIEVGVDERFDSTSFVTAVEYKTTASSVPGGGTSGAWDDGVVLQLPLYAHALAQQSESKVARAEYRAIKQARAVYPLELHRFDRKAGDVVEGPGATLMESALDSVAEHVRRIRQGEFAAKPATSCGCPPFCHALEICRVAGGPRVGGRR